MGAPARPGHDVAPRYATPRTDRPSYGAAVGMVAQALGRPLQPWQQLVADVGTELLPDGSWAYRVVVVHVQRQAGKTTLLGPKNVHRCLTRPGAKTWLTAQRRQDGRDTWRDVAELVGRSPLAGVLTMRRSNGSEELAVPATGASFRVFAPSEDALHGKANEAVDVDEAWAFDAAQGQALEQAILPTFATTGGQLWLVSTAGTAASTWLRGYVERGRAAAAAGMTSGLAYFEWSLAPADAELVTDTLHQLHRDGSAGDDQLDHMAALDQAVELVLAAHPGQYVRADAVRQAALTMAPGEFLRAYGNVWTLTADRVVADHLWTACLDRELPAPQAGQLALAFDVGLDRHAAVSASWRQDGRRAVDVIDSRPGTGWLVERLEQLARRLAVPELVCDGQGPALDVADQLERRGWKVRRLTTVEYLTACAGFLADVEHGQLVHRGTPALDEAVAAAARRSVGDRWAWSRRGSAGPIAGLVAATVAGYALEHAPAQLPAPQLLLSATTPAAPRAAVERQSLVL